MITPNDMPKRGNGLTTVTRHRQFGCPCCGLERREKVPAIKRGPRRIRSTAMADALRSAGLVR